MIYTQHAETVETVDGPSLNSNDAEVRTNPYIQVRDAYFITHTGLSPKKFPDKVFTKTF